LPIFLNLFFRGMCWYWIYWYKNQLRRERICASWMVWFWWRFFKLQ